MKTCHYCKRDDLHVEARKCPHCGSWQSPMGRLLAFCAMSTGALVWVILLIFLLALATCAGELISEV